MQHMKIMAAAAFLLAGATLAHPVPTKQPHPVQTTSPTKQDGRDGHRGVKGVNGGAGEKGEDGKTAGMVAGVEMVRMADRLHAGIAQPGLCAAF
ncbi:hypothetical protein RLQ39_003432 [Salmonella enterica]|nr:hypothetical protein [Salmonella enterica]